MKTTITGELRAAPDTVSDETIPSGSSLLDFTSARDYAVQTGLMVRQLLDANAFVTLDGTGSSGAVTNVAILVLRASAPTTLRLTQLGGSAQIIDICGPTPTILGFDPSKPVTLLEAKGVGKVEYFVAGPK